MCVHVCACTHTTCVVCLFIVISQLKPHRADVVEMGRSSPEYPWARMLAWAVCIITAIIKAPTHYRCIISADAVWTKRLLSLFKICLNPGLLSHICLQTICGVVCTLAEEVEWKWTVHHRWIIYDSSLHLDSLALPWNVISVRMDYCWSNGGSDSVQK